VVLIRLEEDAVAGADDLDRAALALAETDALGDPDRLPARVRVPGVRASGVKCTEAAPMDESSDGAATVSTYTAPVKQSLGPRFVSRVFLVICNGVSWTVGYWGSG
jgi:hypothetical protein